MHGRKHVTSSGILYPEASSFQVSCSCISLLEEVTHDLLFPTQAVQAHSRHEHRFSVSGINERKIGLSLFLGLIFIIHFLV